MTVLWSQPALYAPTRSNHSGDPELEPSLATSRIAVCRGSRRGWAPGQCPGHDVPVAPTRADDEVRISGFEANDDPAGRCGGRGPQPRHGAIAALDRWSVPARPERSQCIAIAGRGRPSVARRGRAARKARQPPRSRARTLPSGRRRTVARVVAAWNEPAARTRDADRATRRRVPNRAAERASNSRRCVLTGHGTASNGRCK